MGVLTWGEVQMLVLASTLCTSPTASLPTEGPAATSASAVAAFNTTTSGCDCGLATLKIVTRGRITVAAVSAASCESRGSYFYDDDTRYVRQCQGICSLNKGHSCGPIKTRHKKIPMSIPISTGQLK